MSEFWLQDDDSNTLELESNVPVLTLGGTTRSYKVDNYAGAPGGILRGFGTPAAKKFKFTRREKTEDGDNNAWNSRRNAFLRWLTFPKWKNLWLYIRNGEDTFTVKTQVYISKVGDEKYKYIKVSDDRTIELISPSGLFKKTTANTDTLAITGSTSQSLAVTNNGTWEASIQCKFTPTADQTLFSVWIADSYGFILEKTSFPASEQIVYDTDDNSLTIDGETQLLSQYLTGGSIFNLPAGSSTLYIQCSGAGSFAYSYYERYV